jgi:hypothetical protein
MYAYMESITKTLKVKEGIRRGEGDHFGPSLKILHLRVRKAEFNTH